MTILDLLRAESPETAYAITTDSDFICSDCVEQFPNRWQFQCISTETDRPDARCEHCGDYIYNNNRSYW